MDAWTPSMRNSFIATALNSDKEKGNNGPYWFNVFPKSNKPDEESPKKALVTKALMNTIFSNPKYRIIVLKIYEILINKITSNPFTRQHYHKNIMVVLKGGVSYTYILGKADDTFPYSDLDVVVMINPHLPQAVFESIKEALNTIVLQTISQYKRSIDFMFFSNRNRMSQEQVDKQRAEQFMSDELVEQFQKDYNAAISELCDDSCDGMFVSPLESNEFRNAASRHSYIIANSHTHAESVVRVDVPHFEMCERIPLKKTPLFCSHNRSISFNRNADKQHQQLKGAFDLYRIRFNNMFVPNVPETADDASSDSGSSNHGGSGRLRREHVTADFVDISIPAQDDVELREFWNNGRILMVNDITSNIWLAIPDLPTMINDLHKMLTVYECPEAKRAKRQLRYDILKNLHTMNDAKN